MHKLRFLLAFWLTIAATGTWAAERAGATVDTIPANQQVKMIDGRMVTPKRVATRATSEDYTYTYKGVKYTYISEYNYTRFFDTNVHHPHHYGWVIDGDGWFTVGGSTYLVAASIDEESVPSNGEVYILNDLVGYFTSHTHLACVADHGFTGKSKVKRIYFQDSDAWSYNANSDFKFFIGHRAFNNAPQLEKIDLMQYITRGTNHWESMPTNSIVRIWSNMLEGSDNAMIRVATSTLNDYRSSGMWSELKDRIISYEPSGYEINEYGARYKCLLADDGKTYLTNDGAQRETVLQRLRPWNADYQSFNASSLMAPVDNGATVYYTTVEGNDADYLQKNNGVLKVYNDIGSYYNYKTIAIRRNAFLNCEDLKAVEFHQTNGRSENSYSDLKVCIENGAFRGCKNLKEIRLYYYAQDGDDHWETLGPENVVPGDDIFGWGADFNEAGEDEYIDVEDDPELYIIVSPTRYMDFINDPNWGKYAPYIVAADYEPTTWSPITEGGLTYDYASKTPNAASTSQVVTVETSWWTAVYWAVELAITVATMGTNKGAEAAAKAAAEKGASVAATEANLTALKSTESIALNLAKGKGTGALVKAARDGTEKALIKALGQGIAIKDNTALFEALIKAGFVSKSHALLDDKLFRNILYLRIHKESLLKLSQIVSDWASKQIVAKTALLAEQQAALKPLLLSLAKARLKQKIAKTVLGSTAAAYVGTRFIPQIQSLGSETNTDQLQSALADNMAANIHQVGMVGLGFTTPDKKLIYHTYISKAEAGKTDFTIYNDVGSVYNYRTVGISRKAFMGNKTVQTIKFAESRGSNFDSYESLLFTIPDSAFAGCTALREFDLRYTTAKGGQLGLGPENFILCGDSIFGGCDSTQLRIIVAEERLQDFLDNDSWAKYKRFLTTGKIEEKKATSGYGVNYAYAYTNNSTRHITYSMGHEVEHLYAYGADDDFLNKNSGAIGLFNDVGNWNNYHLDYVKHGAFEGNQNLKEVSFWNVNGISIFGESYETIDITLQDNCFNNCKNLEQMGLVYLSHSGTMRGSVKPLTPATLRLGDHVFDNTPNLKLKMMPSQMEAFMADSAWASYKDKFLPCLITPVDAAVKSALSDLRYTLHCSTMNNTWDIIDVSLLKEKDYSFYENFNRNEKIKQFPEFKQFELAGLDFVGNAWFVACNNLTTIEFPSTIKSIGSYSFQMCDLREIEIPAAVTEIGEEAFSYNSNLKTVRCLGTKPASLDERVFGWLKLIYDSEGLPRGSEWVPYDGFKIYVPAGAVDDYKRAWSQYKDYIVAYEGQKTFPKEVTTTKVGELASKLGLETVMDGNNLEGLYGAYWKIDSLTVSGPLNGVDVGVLRFLGGADVNNSEPTAGQLKYLNLYGAQLKKDTDHPYQCWGTNDYLTEDNLVGDFMFTYCKSLQTFILPKTAKKMGENVFEEAHGLKRLAIGDDIVEADNELFEDVEQPLEELVFLKSLCKSDEDDCWTPGTEVAYVPRSLVGDFLGRSELTCATSNIVAAFEDDEALNSFTAKGHFFPSEYFGLSNIDGILSDRVKSFDELYNFQKMTNLGAALRGCRSLEKVTLPESLTTIGYSAFQGCTSLKSITVSADSAATLESGTFRDLPADFCIYVPKTHAKRYREAWAEYADHIVGSDQTDDSDIIEVTLRFENTLHEALGLEVSDTRLHLTETKYDANGNPQKIEVLHKAKVTGISGDYSHITRLKINGPISGEDLAVLRYLAGYCPWTDKPNRAGRLEYLDLYDAKLVPSPWLFAQDKLSTRSDQVTDEDVLPAYAFLQAYQLKTLILPKTLKEIRSRAIMQCEALETVVIGDDIETINWSAFDDDVSLTRMYLLAKKKPEMDADNFVWRNLCNNYNPTFDAFYVRPSLYNDYVNDAAYTGNSWQRTNNISTGEFKEDDAFAAFAAHAAATQDDLGDVTDVTGWFKDHTAIKDLTPLRYTLVESLKAEDMQPLTQLQRIAMPMMLGNIDDDAFANAKDLRWADFMMCDSLELLNNLKNGGLRNKGLSEKTLCFMPSEYGVTDEVNVAAPEAPGAFQLSAKTIRIYDGQDYVMPYYVVAEKIENTRMLPRSDKPYSVCLPYQLSIPEGAVVYRLDDCRNNELVFMAINSNFMMEGQPYLVRATNDVSLDADYQKLYPDYQLWPGQQDVAGFTMRGTVNGIDNAEASELGAYVLQSDGKWHAVMADTEKHRAIDIPAYRCYLLKNRGAGARTISMTLDDNTTGIERIRTIDNDGTERLYDLNGRLLNGNAKGVVIKNDKKVIIK